MLNLFKKKSHILLGIDISSTSIKLVELSYKNNTYCLESFSRCPLPTRSVIEGNIQDINAVSSTIRQAIKKSKSNIKNVAVCVSGSAVITKKITMDASLTEDEIETQIALDADQYIPYPLEEVAIDFDVIQKIKDSNEIEVLLAGCRRTNIETITQVIKMSGLKALVVDIESYANERAIKLMQPSINLPNPEAKIAFFDIGANSTTLNIITNGQVLYSREELFGGRQLTEQIQQHYRVDFDEAEKIQTTNNNSYGFDDYHSKALKPFTESLYIQMNRSLQYFYSSSSNNHIDLVLLSGGVSSLPNLCSLVQKKLNISTIIANPFSHMEISKKINCDEFNLIAPSFTVACGLAMRGFE